MDLVTALPEAIREWLEDPALTELVLPRPGEAVLVRGKITEQKGTGLSPQALRQVVDAVRRQVGARSGRWNDRFDVRAVDTPAGGGLRLMRRAPMAHSLRSLSRAGKLLPEVRAFLEEAIRCRRSGLLALCDARSTAPLFHAIVAEWRELSWVVDVEDIVSDLGIDGAVGLGVDGFVCANIGQLNLELVLQPRPVWVRVEAPDAASAAFRALAQIGLRRPDLTMDQIRCATASKFDFVVEEETDGRSRGVWRILEPDHRLEVDFVTGTRVRFGPRADPRRTEKLPAEPGQLGPRPSERPSPSRPTDSDPARRWDSHGDEDRMPLHRPPSDIDARSLLMDSNALAQGPSGHDAQSTTTELPILAEEDEQKALRSAEDSSPEPGP
ncbi:MAG: hypothetical protein ACFB9M_03160 [Myxococcota bacterium]